MVAFAEGLIIQISEIKSGKKKVSGYYLMIQPQCLPRKKTLGEICALPLKVTLILTSEKFQDK